MTVYQGAGLGGAYGSTFLTGFLVTLLLRVQSSVICLRVVEI